MNLEQAKLEAVKIIGPGTTLFRTENGWCKVQSADGKTLGAGQSWLEALRAAALPYLQAEEARKKVAQQRLEAQRRADMAEFEQFLTFLREHLKAPYEVWKLERIEKKKAEEDLKALVAKQAAEGISKDPEIIEAAQGAAESAP